MACQIVASRSLLNSGGGVRASEAQSFGNLRSRMFDGKFGQQPARSVHSDQMSFFSKLLVGLTPPPTIVPEEYDGLEWRWKAFVVRPACMFPSLERVLACALTPDLGRLPE